MELRDVAPVEEWKALEKEINRRWGLNAAVFDPEGARVTDFVKWANGLCPLIKGHEKGGRFICAVAHQNLATQARKSREPVVDACDAGMFKLVVPIFADDVFLGVAGGCGRLDSEEEIDAFIITKTIGLPAERIQELGAGVPRIRRSEARDIAAYIQIEVERILEAGSRQAAPK